MATSAYWGTDATKPTGLKDPDAQIDISFDWTEYLAETGDSIVTQTILIGAPQGDATPLTSASSSVAGGVVTAFLNGGTVGATYKVTSRITTGSSPLRRDDRTVYIKIEER
jgi:hypothetical protein